MIAAVPAHAPVMAALHEAAFPPGERWGADALALQLGLPGAAGWICGTAGFVLFRVAADEAEILTLAVHPARRRRGVGRSLLCAARASAAASGARSMFLEVAEGNEPAARLYGSAGFTDVGRRPRYYPGGRDARVLRAELPAPPPVFNTGVATEG